MAQYEEDEQYITGGVIDDTPEPVPQGLLKMFSPQTVDAVSTSTWQQNELERYEDPFTGPGGLVEPITTIPGLSQISRAIGNAAKAIDEILPTTPLDPYIPNVETIANFTPGVGDLQTGEYSALDMLGVGLDVFGLGAAAKLAKNRKAQKVFNVDDHRMLETQRRLSDWEVINEAHRVTPRVDTPYDRLARQRILDRNTEARANLEGEVIRPYEPSPAIREQLDRIGAPSNEEFARMNAEFEAGIIPEGVVDALPSGALRELDAAGQVTARLNTKLDNVKYENFNIDQMGLFDEISSGGGNFTKVEKRFFRDEKSKSNVVVKLEPTGRSSELRIQLTEGGKVNAAGEIDAMDDIGRSYFSYYIKQEGDISRIHGVYFYGRGKGIRPQVEASRLIRDAFDHAPGNAVLDEQLMTMDALYMTLKEMVRRPKGTFHIDPTRIKHSKSSEFSRPSKLAKEGKADEMIQIFAELEQKLIKQGKIKPGESLGLEVSHIGGDVELKLQQFTISDFKAAAPVMLGFKDWEEMSNYLDSQDDTVNAVMDLEKGLFND